MNGYLEASKIEMDISLLLQKYSLEENSEEWWHFARSLGATMEILEKQAKEKLSLSRDL